MLQVALSRQHHLMIAHLTADCRVIILPTSVQQGETVQFIVKNSGKVKHEMVLGTEKELKEHDEVMKKHPEMEHAAPNMVTVAPGKTGEVARQFTKADNVYFACLQPGHYGAGMKGQVRMSDGVAAQVGVAVSSTSASP